MEPGVTEPVIDCVEPDMALLGMVATDVLLERGIMGKCKLALFPF